MRVDRRNERDRASGRLLWTTPANPLGRNAPSCRKIQCSLWKRNWKFDYTSRVHPPFLRGNSIASSDCTPIELVPLLLFGSFLSFRLVGEYSTVFFSIRVRNDSKPLPCFLFLDRLIAFPIEIIHAKENKNFQILLVQW